MKIFVAGGAGFIGSAAVQALAAQGHTVSASIYSRDPDPRFSGVRYQELDLTARGAWHLALQDSPDIVYMCAGKSGGSGLDPLHFVTDNALMHLQMFRACAEAGVKRIVALSSTTGYPDSGEAMKEEDYFTGEPHPAYFNPGHTRRFIERLGAMYPQIETVWIRVAGVYGPGADFEPDSSHVIEATIRKVAERQNPLVLWGDGSAVRDAIYIDDLATALRMAADWPAGAYNLGTGIGMSVDEMLHTLLAHSGHECRIERDLSRPQMIAKRALDCNKALAIGWHANVSMREGLRRTLEWYERR